MQNLDAIEAPLGSKVNARVDVSKFFTIKLPERICRHSKTHTATYLSRTAGLLSHTGGHGPASGACQ
jgi:hypothetical protein